MSALPVQLTSFVGREAELAEAEALAASSRLLTLTGAGGCGKTRLAVELAGRLSRDHGETRFCDLTAAADPEMVPGIVAGSVGVEAAGLAQWLRSNPCLLVLDNCEHVLEAAAGVATKLLRECAGLRILATSREPMQVPGEVTMRVPALPVREAARLFVERARLAQPRFELTAETSSHVAEVCSRLDGVPLALELAAAQLRGMSLDTLLLGLRDRFRLLVGRGAGVPERQRTLEATVAWGFELLSPAEQTVFSRLSVLAGAFSLEKALAVAAGDPVPEADVLPLITRLVERSMVELAGGTGYLMAESLREYGRMALRRGGDEVDVLRRAAVDAGSRQEHWAALSLLRGALERLPGDDPGRRELLDRLAWEAECAGSYALGARALEELDGLLAGESDIAARAAVQLRLSNFLPMASGDLDDAEAAAHRARALYVAAGQPDRALAVAGQLAWARGYRGDLAGQAAAARAVAGQAEAAGDRMVLRNALGALGAVQVVLGDFEPARSTLERGHAIAAEDHDVTQQGWFTATLAFADALSGRLARGRARLDVALTEVEEPGALELEVSTFLHYLAGRYDAALQDVIDREPLVTLFHLRGAWMLSMAAAAAAELGRPALARSLALRAYDLVGERDYLYQSHALRWMLGLTAWSLGDADGAVELLRRAATGLSGIGALPLAALCFRDLVDACPASDVAQWAEAELARCAARLRPQLYRTIASPASEETAAELGRIGCHGLRARTLHRAGRLDEAVAAYERLGCEPRRRQALAELALSGQAARSPGAHALASLILFEDVPAPDLEELAARLALGSYAAGELVHRRYDEARTVELVESGRVRLSIGTHAGEKVLGVAGPGEVFGERALIDGELRATDAVVIEGCRLLSIPAADLLRFIESRPAIAERTLTAVRMRLRQESELTREPEPADVAARLLGSVQRLSAAEGRSRPAYEILPLYLVDGTAWLLCPETSESMQVEAGAGALPADAVGASLAAVGLEAEIVHSTSWRYEGGRLVLTYLAVLPQAVRATGFEAVPVVRAELARGTAKGAPTEIGVGQVVEHGLRHLCWLSKDDPIIREALPGEWLRLVDAYQPEPFRAL